MGGRPRWIAAAALCGILAGVAWSYLAGGFAFAIFSPELDGPGKVRFIQDYFEGWGKAAPLVYVVIVVVEVVVAPIPGTLLYVPGGLVFGWLLGGVTSLAGNVIGAGICCALSRSLGRPFLERFVPADSLRKYDRILSRNALWVVLLLRINPLTSSDLVSYAAGLTSMSTWRVMLGTLFGMAPLCFAQAYFAEELFTRFPVLLYPLAVVCLFYVLYVVRILARLRPLSSEDSA